MQTTDAIAVCFKDQGIAELFSALLNVVGETGVTVEDISLVPENARVITEPLFFENLSEQQKQTCLLVGPSNSMKGLNANCIEQPLTEQKIDTALDLFLGKSQV